MTKKEKVEFIINELNRLYPHSKCSLNYSHPHELLIATRLSAQCTDERVNIVTKELFERYRSLDDFSKADYDELCQMIHSCGFFRDKAKSIIEMSGQILDKFDGMVPDTIEELTTLSGIGRKTANLICADIYGKPGIIADTHCIRLSNRLGLVEDSDNPIIVERQLKKIIPADHQTKLCHNFVFHGRAVCSARSPSCNSCTLSSACSFFIKTEKERAKKS